MSNGSIDRCPRCGYTDPQGPECPRCGVVFSKVRSAKDRSRKQGTGRDPAPRSPAPTWLIPDSPTGRLPLVLLVAVGLVALMMLIDWNPPSPPAPGSRVVPEATRPVPAEGGEVASIEEPEEAPVTN